MHLPSSHNVLRQSCLETLYQKGKAHVNMAADQEEKYICNASKKTNKKQNKENNIPAIT